MADGREVPIDSLHMGDRVIATDPQMGVTRAEPVEQVIVGHGLTHLVTVTVAEPTLGSLHPRDEETDDEYRARLRAWFDAIPSSSNETPGFRWTSWKYICSLAGIDPGPEPGTE